MLNEKLKELGLSEKEADVYLAMNKLGSSVASVIARKAGINRSTTYVILESLLKRGLINVIERRGVNLYAAAAPEKLIQYMESQAKQFSERAEIAREILPKLKTTPESHESDSKPRVHFFEGTEGVKTVYENSLGSLETVRTYGSPVGIPGLSPNYFEDYYKRLAKKNIDVKILYPGNNDIQKSSGKESGKYGLPPELSIYDNKVVFVSGAEKFGMIIESKELAEALKKAFDLSWKEAKQLSKKSALDSGISPEMAS